MTKFYLGLFTLMLLNLSGCRWVDDTVKEITENATKAQVEELTKPMLARLHASEALASEQSIKLEQLRQEFDTALKELTVLRFTVSMNEDNYKSESANLTSDASGYSIARTKLGPAIISLQTITPYLDGFKVKLWVTVLVPVELSGLKGKVSWRETDPEVLKKDKDSWRKKEFTSPATFQSGRYTEIEVVLTPASAAGLKQFWVDLQTDNVSVARPISTPPASR